MIFVQLCATVQWQTIIYSDAVVLGACLPCAMQCIQTGKDLRCLLVSSSPLAGGAARVATLCTTGTT
jgi:hypothetical protein